MAGKTILMGGLLIIILGSVAYLGAKKMEVLGCQKTITKVLRDLAPGTVMALEMDGKLDAATAEYCEKTLK